MDITSATLLHRLRQPGHQEAWSRFVDLYTPLLLKWARRLGLQDADTADLVQDVFARLVGKLPAFEYDRGRSFRGWLRTVATNHWRAGFRKRSVPTAAGADPALAAAPEEEAFWEDEYRKQVVGRALDLMKAEFQTTTWKACWECVVNDRPAAAVAVEFGLQPGAVRAAKFRVLARLREELAGLLD